MAFKKVGDVRHDFAPNPKLGGDDWAAEYPPIKSDAKLLINKFTKDIVPNTVEFAKRSDVYEPYFGDPFAKDQPNADVPDPAGVMAVANLVSAVAGQIRAGNEVAVADPTTQADTELKPTASNEVDPGLIKL